MALSGVLISCEIFCKNADFSLSLSSAFSFAKISAFSIAFLLVISSEMPSRYLF